MTPSLPITRTTLLDCGIRVVSQAMPHLHAVTVGIWVDSGSDDELDADAGAAHFLEHLLFKGTSRRTARQITGEMEELGAQVNAFTGHDTVCYYARALSANLAPVFDVLADMVTGSLLPQVEIDKERGVVLQEIKRAADDPESCLYSRFSGEFWSGSPLGFDVIGREEVIAGISRDRLLEHLKRNYTADRIVVSAAGAVEHDQLVALAADKLKGIAPASDRHRVKSRPAGRVGVVQFERAMEQAQVCIGFPAINAGHAERDQLSMANLILGSGMSSMLFQEVREQRGLAYSVHSVPLAFRDSGALLVQTGTAPEKAAEAVSVSIEQCRRVARGDFDDARFAAARQQMLGRFLLSLDSPDGQMSRIARSLFTGGRVEEAGEVVSAITSLTRDAVVAVADRYLGRAEPLVVVLGPLDRVGAIES